MAASDIDQSSETKQDIHDEKIWMMEMSPPHEPRIWDQSTYYPSAHLRSCGVLFAQLGKDSKAQVNFMPAKAKSSRSGWRITRSAGRREICSRFGNAQVA